MNVKEKSYLIKVPVYTTEMTENSQDIFGGISYHDMNGFLKKKIESFQKQGVPVEYENRNKTKRTVINKITFSDHPTANASALLLQISAYSTNFYDGYLEAEQKIKFKKDHKVGSDTNFVMIYPMIKGLTKNSYSRYFIVLIYEDPTKSNDEIVRITKVVLRHLLGIPVANIKLPTILEELREIKTIPELQMKYSSVYYHQNDVDINYREYLVDGKFKKQKEDQFRNMPVEKIEDILNEPNIEYQKRVVRVTVGKKEYKITQEMIKEAGEAMKETAEKVFNASSAITQEELENELHDPDFILSKLFPVLENFLANDSHGD